LLGQNSHMSAADESGLLAAKASASRQIKLGIRIFQVEIYSLWLSFHLGCRLYCVKIDRFLV